MMIRRFLLSLLVAVSVAASAVPIAPVSQSTKTISCAVTTSATALSGVAGQTQLEIQNAGTVAVFVETGVSTVTAAVATGYPILAGQAKVITVNASTTHLACISSSGTQTVYVTTGFGE